MYMRENKEDAKSTEFSWKNGGVQLSSWGRLPILWDGGNPILENHGDHNEA